MNFLDGWNFWWKLIYLLAAVFTVGAVIELISYIFKNYRDEMYWWYVDKMSTIKIRSSAIKRMLRDDEHLDVPPKWGNRSLYRETSLEPITINKVIFERNKTNG